MCVGGDDGKNVGAYSHILSKNCESGGVVKLVVGRLQYGGKDGWLNISHAGLSTYLAGGRPQMDMEVTKRYFSP